MTTNAQRVSRYLGLEKRSGAGLEGIGANVRLAPQIAKNLFADKNPQLFPDQGDSWLKEERRSEYSPFTDPHRAAMQATGRPVKSVKAMRDNDDLKTTNVFGRSEPGFIDRASEIVYDGALLSEMARKFVRDTPLRALGLIPSYQGRFRTAYDPKSDPHRAAMQAVKTK